MVKIKSQRRHTRILFTPLTTGVSLECVTPDSPLLQTFVSTTKEGEQPHYDPDHKLSPTVIYPHVQTFDQDGVFVSGNVNDLLSTLKGSLVWLVDGTPIEEVWKASTDGGATGDYAIDLSASSGRGTLSIYRNLKVKETHTLKFRGQFVDPRTNLTYKVESNEALIALAEKGEDSLGCSLSENHIIYDPVYDDLLLYDYKKARGIDVGSVTRESLKNGKSFDKTINVIFSQGQKTLDVLPEGITMQLVENGSNVPLTPGGAHPELVEVKYPNIRFDLRLIEKKEYEVRFMKDNKMVCHAYLSVTFSPTCPTSCKLFNGVELAARQKNYSNSAIINIDKRFVEYPELYFLIEWFTQARKKVEQEVNGMKVVKWVMDEEKLWQRGERMNAAVRDLGVGYSYNDACFDIWFDVDVHKVATVALDETGNVLVDENGDTLID